MRFTDKLNLGYCIHTKMGESIIQVKMQEMQDLEDSNKKPENSSPFCFPPLKTGKQKGNLTS